jgi:hypothetical protein
MGMLESMSNWEISIFKEVAKMPKRKPAQKKTRKKAKKQKK